MKKYYRAAPIDKDMIRKNDFLTLYRKYAIDHAITTSMYKGVDYAVYFVYLKENDVYEHYNPGEYRYLHDSEVKAKLLGIAKYNDDHVISTFSYELFD